MFEYLQTALSVIGVGIAILGTALYLYQDGLLYFPQFPQGSRTDILMPRDIGIVGDEVWITTSDGLKLQSFWFPCTKVQDTKSVPTMLFFHENAGSVIHRFPNIKAILQHINCNVYVISYRGYGRSEGSPNEKGLCIDAQAAFSYLISRPDVDPEKVFIFGRSLGGAVAVHLANELGFPTIKGLIIENTFTSIPDMVEIVMPYLRYFTSLATNRWESEKKIGNIKMPIMFIASLQDEVVPARLMRVLHSKATGATKKEWLELKASHMDAWYIHGPAYFDKMRRFIEQDIFGSISTK